MSKIIKSVIVQAAKNFANSLRYFYPAHQNNGFNERNLSYQFAKAFEERPEACAFMEVPFQNQAAGRFDNHIDCLVFDAHITIFIECKRLYSREKAESLSEDLRRMSAENTLPLLDKLCRGRAPSKKRYRMVLVENWQESILNWWMARPSKINWPRELLPKTLTYGYIEVKPYQDGTLYWLYAFGLIEE